MSAWTTQLIPAHQRHDNLVRLGNHTAVDGFSRCECGCKYWEHDRCIDCGESHDIERHDG